MREAHQKGQTQKGASSDGCSLCAPISERRGYDVASDHTVASNKHRTLDQHWTSRFSVASLLFCHAVNGAQAE